MGVVVVFIGFVVVAAILLGLEWLSCQSPANRDHHPAEGRQPARRFRLR